MVLKVWGGEEEDPRGWVRREGSSRGVWPLQNGPVKEGRRPISRGHHPRTSCISLSLSLPPLEFLSFTTRLSFSLSSSAKRERVCRVWKVGHIHVSQPLSRVIITFKAPTHLSLSFAFFTFSFPQQHRPLIFWACLPSPRNHFLPFYTAIDF